MLNPLTIVSITLLTIVTINNGLTAAEYRITRISGDDLHSKDIDTDKAKKEFAKIIKQKPDYQGFIAKWSPETMPKVKSVQYEIRPVKGNIHEYHREAGCVIRHEGKFSVTVWIDGKDE